MPRCLASRARGSLRVIGADGSMRCLGIGLALMVFLAGGAAGVEDCQVPADLHDGWTVAAPAAQGLDPALVCAIGPRFEAWTEANLHGVVVVRHDALVYEHYLAGEDERWGQPLGRVAYDAGKLHDLRSITKSVTSLVVGIALDRGWVKDVDASIFSFFPEYAELRTPEKDGITLRHLLTMSAGFAWTDPSMSYGNQADTESLMIRAADPYRYLLELPLATPPGKSYHYDSGETSLLAAVLQKASGKGFDVLAQEVLFDPLGISDIEWMRYPNGDPIAGWGLRVRPRDLAKVGQLMLDHGRWHGKQIVPEAWITQSTAPQFNGEGLFFYGYQWWLGRSLIGRREIDWIAGVGLGGQRLFIVPDQDLVVAVTAGLYKSPLQSQVGFTVLNTYVLPATGD
jgi:CubicO group peptidase (beta-lactamase class C family)